MAKALKHQVAMQSDDWPMFFKRRAVNTKRHQRMHLPPMHRVVVAQLALSVVLALIALPAGITYALSSLAGGLCCTLPNAYFVWRAFRYSGARSAKLIVSSFYRGEAGKLVLTAAGFTLVFTQIKTLEPLALFGAFILVQAVNWFAPLLLVRRKLGVNQL